MADPSTSQRENTSVCEIMIAKMNLIVVVSACPMDLNPVGGQGITDLEILAANSKDKIMKVLKF